MIMTRLSLRALVLPVLFAAACGGTGLESGGAGSGGATGSSAGAGGSGGASDTGAALGGISGGGAGALGTSAGGTVGGSGGKTSSGGAATGNSPASGGTVASGGTKGSGGAMVVSGGIMGSSAGGGTTSSGGTAASGGTKGSGGATVGSGGTTSSSGGTMGGRAGGGTTSSGGAAAGNGGGGSSGPGSTGGAAGSGGAAGTRDAGVAGGSGNRDAGSTPTGGTGGTASNCTTPPDPSPLVGWATASGSTTGGGNATPVTVTTLTDLQSAVKGTSAAVIYVKGVLAAGSVTMGSNKTIVGLCGAEIHGHLGINKQSNIIIRNIKIVGYAVGDCSLDPDYSSATGCSSGNDAITVQGQSDHIWLDHDDISDGTDGNLDITHADDFITISWTKFHYSSARTDPTGSDSTGANGHRFSNLVGHSDSNGTEDTGHLTITWHHNWWADYVVERQPRVRFGRVHVFNNLYTSVGDNYCIGVGVGANLRTENNVFVGVKTPINTISYSDATSAISSSDNLYSGTSGDAPADLQASSVFDPASVYTYTLDDTGGLQSAIESGAGPK